MIEHLAARGRSVTQIAQEVGLSTATVSRLLKTPESIVRVEDIFAQIRSQIISECSI